MFGQLSLHPFSLSLSLSHSLSLSSITDWFTARPAVDRKLINVMPHFYRAYESYCFAAEVIRVNGQVGGGIHVCMCAVELYGVSDSIRLGNN